MRKLKNRYSPIKYCLPYLPEGGQENNYTASSSNVYHLADDAEDHTYHELSEPAQSELPPSGNQDTNTDEDNYYHTLTNDDVDEVPPTTVSASGK